MWPFTPLRPSQSGNSSGKEDGSGTGRVLVAQLGGLAVSGLRSPSTLKLRDPHLGHMRPEGDG